MRKISSLFVSLAICASVFFGCDDEDSSVFITTEALPDGRVLIDYEFQLQADDVDGECVWTIAAGNLPPGLSLSEAGVLSGLPEKSGVYELTVQATDDSGTDDLDFALTVPKVVLMSGFEPFGTYSTNPSWESIKDLNEELVSGLDVRVMEIPVVWGESWDLLRDEIERLNADVVIPTGQAPSNAMRFEITARNDAFGADNDSVSMDGPIDEDGADTIPSTLPVSSMEAAMSGGGFSTMISEDASNFLCNYVFYKLMQYAEGKDEILAAGFIHVPPAPFPGCTFSVEDVTDAQRLGIGALAAWLEDGMPDDGEPVPDTFVGPRY